MFNFNLRTSRSGREYSPGVLIANWNEDVYLEEDLLKDFIYRRERGELLIQRSNKLKENLYKKEQLSISNDGFLHFGDTVLLVSPDDKSAMESSPCERGNLSLAVTPDEMAIHALDALPSPCGVSAIRVTDPIGRNAFQILRNAFAEKVAVRRAANLTHAKEVKEQQIRGSCAVAAGAVGSVEDPRVFSRGYPVAYALRGHPWETPCDLGKILAWERREDFMIECDHKTFENKAKKSLLQAVSLTDELSYLASWQVTYLDPQLRLEYEGFPVPANNTKILITHCHTNQELAVPRTFWTRTYFGKEYEVVCNTYLNSHRAEEDKNYWIMVTGNPSDGSTTMFDRPPPPSEVTREKSSEVQTET